LELLARVSGRRCLREQLYRPLNFGSFGPGDPNHRIPTSKLQRSLELLWMLQPVRLTLRAGFGIWSFLTALAGTRRFRGHLHGAFELRFFRLQAEVVGIEIIDLSHLIGC
jgi:hypothetical protein